MKHLLIVIFFMSCQSSILGQGQKLCEKIFKDVDEQPGYPGGVPALHRFMHKELVPILSGCYKQDSTMVTRMTMILVIGVKGQVLKATIADTELSTKCEEWLHKRLLEMTGWIPARRKGVAVCSYYKWEIGCIKWEEGQ